MWGVLPVPPVERFPTDITAFSKLTEVRIPVSNNRFLTTITNPYNKENGYNIIPSNHIESVD